MLARVTQEPLLIEAAPDNMFFTLCWKKELQQIFPSFQPTAHWLELVTWLTNLKRQKATALPDGKDYLGNFWPKTSSPLIEKTEGKQLGGLKAPQVSLGYPILEEF